MKRIRHLLWALLAIGAAAHAQTVQWDPPGGSLSVGRTTEFDLICRDCQLRAQPQPPRIQGLVLRYVATEAGFDISGIAVTKYVFWGYWSKMEDLVLPSFVADTDHGPVTVPEARFEPIAATVGRNKEPLSSAASASLVVPSEVWQGQVFPVRYQIEADANYQPDWSHTAPAWTHAGINAEDWSPPQTHDSTTAAGSRSGLEYTTRAIALQSGSMDLQPERELVNLNVGVAAFGPATPQYEQFSVPCVPATVMVKPLPAPPAGFLGGVGHFTIASHVAPASPAPGEPVTWTVELSGTGNWPQIRSLPARDAPDGFKVVHPQIQRTPEAGKIFDARLTEDLVLVPSRAGRVILPAVHWVYFDPDLGVYQTASTEPAAIEVTGAAVSESETEGETPRLPAGILNLGDLAAAPMSGPALAVAAGAPFVALLFGWLLLALRDARRKDPGLPRRQAWLRQRERLLKIQAAAQGHDAAVLRNLLLEWQRDAVTTWSLPQASPTPESIGDRIEGALWAEADEAIFGPKATLPSDWLVRADQSLASVPPPPFRWSRVLEPRHLFPFVALAIGALSLGAAEPELASAAANYTAGNYADAESAWRGAPVLDAAGKHDVSVALAQQGKWGDAVPFAAEAFVRDPGQKEIRSQFTTTCDRASVDPGPLTRFLSPDHWHRVAQLASPAVWQRGMILGAVIAALGLFLLLLRGYDILRHAWAPIAGLALLGIAMLGGTLAFSAARTYGAAASADAVWVLRPTVMRSIPTEVAGVQASTTVPPGAIGVPDRVFLDWTRLRFDDGAVGWIRQTDTTPLWK